MHAAKGTAELLVLAARRDPAEAADGGRDLQDQEEAVVAAEQAFERVGGDSNPTSECALGGVGGVGGRICASAAPVMCIKLNVHHPPY